MAILIVNLAFFRVPEDFIGFRRFLEFFFGFLVVGVAVRVVFQGQLAVNRFDV